MLHSKNQVINNVLYGYAFGYKPCCISYFNIRQFNGDMFNPTERKLQETGFICCPDCDENYSEDALITDINEKRLFDGSLAMRILLILKSVLFGKCTLFKNMGLAEIVLMIKKKFYNNNSYRARVKV